MYIKNTKDCTMFFVISAKKKTQSRKADLELRRNSTEENALLL